MISVRVSDMLDGLLLFFQGKIGLSDSCASRPALFVAQYEIVFEISFFDC
jgi:hypothetical protein